MGDDVDEGGKRSWKARMRKADLASATVNDALPSTDSLEEDTARWVDLAKAGGAFATAAAKGDIGGLTDPGSAFVRALLDIEEAQARLLRAIDENVKLLRDGPFKTGRLYLSEAYRLVEKPERSREFVERASEQFYQAHSLASTPMDGTAVEMHIGLSAILLGEVDDAQHWLGQAHAKAVGIATELAETSSGFKVGAATMSYVRSSLSPKSLLKTPWGQMKDVKSRYAKRTEGRADEALSEIIPLIGCIASVHNPFVADSDALPTLQLVKSKGNNYELLPAPPGSA